jgi:hypothetical protein
LQNILFELRRPYRDMEEGELRLSLMDYLEPGPNCPNGLLLIVDEAHTLPMRLVEELRLMTNFVREGQARIRLIVSGTVALEERLANPKLDSFNQRVTARCYLHSLGYEEQSHYLRAQIAAAGADPDQLLDESALLAVYQASDGIPRIVNQIMDHALVLAFAAGEERLTGRSIEQAWADLQQLPAPWTEDEDASKQDSVVIEFGELDDIAQPYVDDQLDASEIEVSELSTPDEHEVLESPSLRVATIDEDFECELELGDGVEFQTNEIPAAADPFDEQFEEEEVILDRYASLEDANIRSQLHVRPVNDNPWQLLAELSGDEVDELSGSTSSDTLGPESESDPWSSVASEASVVSDVSDLAIDDPWSVASDENAVASPSIDSVDSYDYSTDTDPNADSLPELLAHERELYETLLDPASDPVLPENVVAPVPIQEEPIQTESLHSESSSSEFSDTENQLCEDARKQVETLVDDVRNNAKLDVDLEALSAGAGAADESNQYLFNVPSADDSVVDVDELLSFGTSVHQLELRVAPTDDRDMIVIEDEPAVRGEVKDSPTHPDYQQILSQMRQS